MSERLPVKKDGNKCYDILLEQDFQALPAALKETGIIRKKVCIVTDSHVAPLYADQLKEYLIPIEESVTEFVFEAGEASKTLATVQKLYEHLIQNHFERKDILIALGGGVVGDLTGFAAATYLRGVDFIQIPTTLLSQVDSSIGGKTGVDFDCYKNMVGAFHMPKLVYINLHTLDTLDDRQFASGMGEVLKHGLIRNASYYEWILGNLYEIEEKEPEVLQHLVSESCKIKRAVVEKDPTEQGDRALLNFGHTIGHAIEKLKDFTMLHGECVALGCVAAAYISWQRGSLLEEEFFEIRDMFVGFGLPISFTGLNTEDIIDTSRSDKKMSGGQVKFILLKGIGKAVIDKTVTEQEMKEAIDYISVKSEDLND